MRTRDQSIKRRLIDGIDWLIDAATLGEYGFEHIGETEAAAECAERSAVRAQRPRSNCERTSSTTTTLIALG